MKLIHRVQTEEALKILGDPTRLEILRVLISNPATITQLGSLLNIHPAQVRNHIKQLEKQGLVDLVSVQMVRNYTEKYYRATASMFFLNMAIQPIPPDHGQLVILSSDDPAMDLLVRMVNLKMNSQHIYSLPVGSLDALIYLKEKYCHIAACHLFDYESGEYNVAFVRHLFSDEIMVMVTLAHRQLGFMVLEGNPKKISGLHDLQRDDVTFIYPKRGSGTRLWIDQHLKILGISPEMLHRYSVDAMIHAETAETIKNGRATTGIGLFSVAKQYGLDFVPLYGDRYDLVMTSEIYASSMFQPVLDVLQSQQFHEQVMELGGYNTMNTGDALRI